MEITRESLQQKIRVLQENVQQSQERLATLRETVKQMELNIAANQGAVQGYQLLLQDMDISDGEPKTVAPIDEQ